MKRKRIALIADVHANFAALEAVLDDCCRRADRICFLGDAVGYGPNPNECIDALRKYCMPGYCLMGNHDHATLYSAEFFSAYARQSIEWARTILTDENMNWLAGLKSHFVRFGALAVHGSPKDYIFDFVLASDATLKKTQKLADYFSQFESFCFNANTHQPCSIFEIKHNQEYGVFEPYDGGRHYQMDGRKAIINVGSVGQPRDRDPRACYAIIEDMTVEWRRIEYDVERTVAEIESNPEISDICGLRLREGR
ncbi:MAG: metallophosphoesterase family protein [Planctomycetes bacterium]|nr:metallophosphoesterase family protein [Planctomycetota bacterium]